MTCKRLTALAALARARIKTVPDLSKARR